MKKSSHPFLSQIVALEEPDYHKILLYGPPRAGKTTFIGSSAFDQRTAPTLVLDFDQGRPSLVNLPDAVKDNLVVANCSSWEDLNRAYDYLANETHPFKTVAVDSLTTIHQYSLSSMATKAYDRSKKDRSKAPRMTEEDTQQQDYNLSLNQMRKFIYGFLRLPMHVIMTAQSKETLTATTIDGDGGGYVRIPNLFGKMAEEAVGMFNTVVYLSQERRQKSPKAPVDRVLVLQNYPEFRTGVRVPWGVKIPNKIRIQQDTGITLLLNAIEGVIKETEETRHLKESDQSGNPIE